MKMRSIYGHDRAKKIRKKQTQSADVLLLDFLLLEGILGLTIETRPSPSESLTPKNILLDILSTHVTHISDPVLIVYPYAAAPYLHIWSFVSSQ